MAGPTFHYRWQWSLQSTVDQLWPLVSNTDQFRSATGFPAAAWTEELTPEGDTRRVGRIQMYGFPIEWQEEPFEWIRHREVTDVQNYRIGPLKQLKVHIQLDPRSGGGTDVIYEVWASPGNILGYPGIPVQIGVIQRYRFGRAFAQMDKYISANTDQPFEVRTTPVSASGSARLRELTSQLTNYGHSAALVKHLIDLVASAPDHELMRMRPFAFADLWHTDRFETLELFLQATKLGMLDLSWDMICPECRGAKHQANHLHDVSHDGYCPSCNINFEVDFARTVEATFQVNPAIKKIMRQEFCMGSPQNTPHILLQQVLAPGETRTLKLLLEPRRYRWRAPKLGRSNSSPRSVNALDSVISGYALLDVNTKVKASASTLTIHDEDMHVEPAEVGAGVVTFRLTNESSSQQIVLLEHTQWSDQATTAAEITSLQSFRDLFSSEALRPGESIGVERMAILFTDLKGSTAMYINHGDAPAFRRVMDHFSILRDGVSRNRGALVKTIGDAIMAVFSDPAHAVEGAIDILRNIETYNAQNPDAQIVLKMGIHQGACIAVTLNERLDYFGSVVNLAARLEGQSQGGDVVISDAMATDPAVEQYIQQDHIVIEPFMANLKGFADSYSLHRLRLSQGADAKIASSGVKTA